MKPQWSLTVAVGLALAAVSLAVFSQSHDQRAHAEQGKAG